MKEEDAVIDDDVLEFRARLRHDELSVVGVTGWCKVLRPADGGTPTAQLDEVLRT